MHTGMHCILSGIPLALWTKRPCKGCWLSLFIVIYWSQLWGQAGSGSRKSSTSLLKESFCDQAKTSGVILDSSNSFMPHFQTVSKSCKSYFENVSSIWLLLNNSTAMTLGHAPVIRPHQLNCGGSSSPHSWLLLSPPQSSLSPVARVILFSCRSIFYLVVLFLLIVNSSLQSRVTYTLQTI